MRQHQQNKIHIIGVSERENGEAGAESLFDKMWLTKTEEENGYSKDFDEDEPNPHQDSL